MKNPSDNIEYHHTLPIQLRFSDVDRFGHVNNVVYFQFYDLGKSEYFATVCPHVDWSAIGIVAVHVTADFLSQIHGTDEIAEREGAIVRYEYKQGKGNVVRSMFRDIDADCYILVDGI